jgi:hypothetical protein
MNLQERGKESWSVIGHVTWGNGEDHDEETRIKLDGSEPGFESGTFKMKIRRITGIFGSNSSPVSVMLICCLKSSI